MTPFQSVYSRLQDLLPSMATRPGTAVQACTCIKEWLDAGCDAELDILPAINATWAKARDKVSSPRFFHNAVMLAMQARTGDANLKKEQAEFRKQALLWKQGRGMFLTEKEEAELASY